MILYFRRILNKGSLLNKGSRIRPREVDENFEEKHRHIMLFIILLFLTSLGSEYVLNKTNIIIYYNTILLYVIS